MSAATAVLLLSACQDVPAELEVGPIAYTEDELLGLPRAQKEVLGSLTAFGLAVARGEADSLGEPLARRARMEYLARAVRAARALDSAEVGDDVLRARYRTDPALELTVRHLLVLSDRYETDETREEARAKAVRALERIRTGEPFPRVAAEVSEEPGAEGRQGLLSPGREGSWVPEFWNAATELEPGEISDVVETQYGFHVLRLEARDTVPFEEVRSEVTLEVAGRMGVETDPAGFEPDVELVTVADLTSAGDPASALTGPDADSRATVVEWEGGQLTTGEFRAHLATLPREEWASTVGSAGALQAAAREAARFHLAAERAVERGLDAPEAVGAEVRRDWGDSVTRWSYVFGFEEGASDETVRTTALEALGATGQGPALARREVHRRGPLLRLRHRVRLRVEPDASGNGRG